MSARPTDWRPAGVLGGLGPMATVYFLATVIRLTEADTDQGHVDMIVWQRSSVPDRTAYLTGVAGAADPLPAMIEAAKSLEGAGATLIAMPCNTAHYFHDALDAAVSIPFLNIVTETIVWARDRVPQLSRLGVLATHGTVQTGTYQRYAAEAGIECLVPDPQVQADVMAQITDVKAGRPVAPERLRAGIEHLRAKGAQAIAIGCTELSQLVQDHDVRDPDVVDSLDSLARTTILRCGKTLRAQSPAPSTRGEH